MQDALPESRTAEIRGDIRDVERYLEYRLEHRDLNTPIKDKIRYAIMDANKPEPW
jgi:hypothetical protein